MDRESLYKNPVLAALGIQQVDDTYSTFEGTDLLFVIRDVKVDGAKHQILLAPNNQGRQYVTLDDFNYRAAKVMRSRLEKSERFVDLYVRVNDIRATLLPEGKKAPFWRVVRGANNEAIAFKKVLWDSDTLSWYDAESGGTYDSMLVRGFERAESPFLA